MADVDVGSDGPSTADGGDSAKLKQSLLDPKVCTPESPRSVAQVVHSTEPDQEMTVTSCQMIQWMTT